MVKGMLSEKRKWTFSFIEGMVFDATTLFYKFYEHEIEQNHLAESEEGDTKKKWLALKAIDVKDIELGDENYQNESDEDTYLLFFKFK